ncbi:type III secretion system protein SctP [Cupriavidus sp. UYPR2.512]|uniref:type III secretion system protein SctP n=1 Tax=Cupriavidus sp. UYPR2.512 TaxID=1080187 RepID=UPI000368AAEB|nr:type III secretion system protein SctP [Cupriavidus sp. UYPR2.512]UIF88541.1 type III secretion system protein SctP [Cupriavidus necator]
MTILEPRLLRIISSDTDQRLAASPPRARRFDYAALARRTRSLRPAVSVDDETAVVQTDSTPRNATSGPDAIRVEDNQANNSSAITEAYAAVEGTRASGGTIAAPEALLQHLPSARRPAVGALFHAQGNFQILACFLAREVAAFCGDPSINEAGNWEACIPLHEHILPDTTLYLTFSRFRVSLRFDTRAIETSQLLYDHSTMLECELASLLNAWGTPRDIELIVW